MDQRGGSVEDSSEMCWCLRRRELDVADLYRENGRYRGVNRSSLIALVLGIAPNAPGFLANVHLVEFHTTFWSTLYTYAWFVGFAVAGGAYYLLEAGRRARAAA